MTQAVVLPAACTGYGAAVGHGLGAAVSSGHDTAVGHSYGAAVGHGSGAAAGVIMEQWAQCYTDGLLQSPLLHNHRPLQRQNHGSLQRHSYGPLQRHGPSINSRQQRRTLICRCPHDDQIGVSKHKC